MFKFTLTIATSVFFLTSSAADLFAMETMDNPDGKPGKQLVIAMTEDAEPGPIHHLPKDLMEVIFIETSKDTNPKNRNPRRLAYVCKSWFNCMRENSFDTLLGTKNKQYVEKLGYLAMNPFMQTCMDIHLDNLHYKGILQFTPTDGSAAVTNKFSGLKNTNGTFNLSECEYTDQYLVITESMNQFFKVGEENKYKTVIGIMPCHRILQEIKNSPEHPFYPLLANLDPDKAPVLLFWRWGSDTNLTCFDYLTTASVCEVSSRNLYENWPRARPNGPRFETVPGLRMMRDFMSIFEPK